MPTAEVHEMKSEDSQLLQKKLVDMEASLAGDFKEKLEELRELQRLRDSRREEEEEAKKKDREDMANRQEVLLEKLLISQVDESKERAEKQRTLNKILGTLLAIVTSGSGVGIYLASKKPTAAEEDRVSAPVKAVVAKEANKVEARVEKAEKKIERLGAIAVEQQVQLSDGVEFIGAKIDAAHPRSADKVDRPASVDAAKRKAESIKVKIGSKNLFSEPDSADPFAGL